MLKVNIRRYFKGAIMFHEFKEFISRGNVMDMAVGIIMGAAFTTIVNSMVGDLIMPVIGVLTSGVDFADKFIALNGETYINLKAAKNAGAPVVTYGVFINAIINFLIVSFAIFVLVKAVNNLKRNHENKNKAPELSKDILLLTEIRDLLAKNKT
jgi:large conductance mechanosensitive channel